MVTGLLKVIPDEDLVNRTVTVWWLSFIDCQTVYYKTDRNHCFYDYNKNAHMFIQRLSYCFLHVNIKNQSPLRAAA